MGQVFEHSTLIAALDAGAGWTDAGFSFLDRDQRETFLSWDALRAEAMRRAAHLRAHGLRQGDRVAMVLPDGEDFVPTFLATVWAGLVPVPLYPPLSLGKLDSYIDTLVGILQKAKPKALVTNAKLEQVLWSGAARIESLNAVITAEELRGPAPEGVSTAPAQVSGDDLCFLQFTSGSTSTPKGVAVTHESLRANCHAIMREGLRCDGARDRGVSWLPLYHDMGLIGFVIAPLFHKVPVTFIPTLAFVRNATIWLETLHRVKGTITFAPNFAYALAAKRAKPEQLARWDLSHVRVFGCGAEPINPTTIQSFVDTFAKTGLKPTAMLPCFGMAEATLAVSFIRLDEALSTDVVDVNAWRAEGEARPAPAAKLATHEAQAFVSCGRTFEHHEIAAFDDAGKRLADRRIGELWLRGPSVARGYYEDDVATQRTFGGGWLKTGDLGYLANGNVFIVGRKKDILIINGRNYDPQRIEWLVDELAGVRKGSSVAFTRPGAASEELVVVLESRTEAPTALVEAVRQTVNEQLQLSCADVVVCPVGSLPKTSSGKLQRARTRQQYLDGVVGKEGNRTLGATGDRLVLARHVALSLWGRGRHRVRKVARHAQDIRNVGDAVEKMKLAGAYVQRRLGTLFN